MCRAGLLETIQGPKKWFAKCEKHYPSRFGQTSLATALTKFTKPVTKNYFGAQRNMTVCWETTVHWQRCHHLSKFVHSMLGLEVLPAFGLDLGPRAVVKRVEGKYQGRPMVSQKIDFEPQ